MKLQDLFTREHAENARTMSVLSVEKLNTDVTLEVLGTESTVYAQARRDYARDQLALKADSQADEPIWADPILQSEMNYAKLVASLVVGWNLEEEFTKDAALQLMYNAPHIAIQVENFATIVCNRLEQEKTDSSVGQSKASD